MMEILMILLGIVIPVVLLKSLDMLGGKKKRTMEALEMKCKCVFVPGNTGYDIDKVAHDLIEMNIDPEFEIQVGD